MITQFEKEIYNSHLISSRKAQNKPFQIRKKFDDLEEDKIIILQKLSRFLKEYPNVDMDTFFIAPHKLFPEETYYSLEYFLTRKAISNYTQYIKHLETQNPDSKESLERLQKSIKFVFEYCKEHQLTFEEYKIYLETGASLPKFIDHLKNHKINFYTLHALNLTQPKIESRILDFIFSNFYSTFQTTKNKYYYSKKMLSFSKLAIAKLESKLNTQ